VTVRRAIAIGLTVICAVMFGYVIRSSDGWRPTAPSIQRSSLPDRQPEGSDLTVMCRQAVIAAVPNLLPGPCDPAYGALEAGLGRAAARTLVQACNDKHAVFEAAAVRLPNASLCRQQSALPAECRHGCSTPAPTQSPKR
jgi:hypothetical protein